MSCVLSSEYRHIKPGFNNLLKNGRAEISGALKGKTVSVLNLVAEIGAREYIPRR